MRGANLGLASKLRVRGRCQGDNDQGKIHENQQPAIELLDGVHRPTENVSEWTRNQSDCLDRQFHHAN